MIRAESRRLAALAVYTSALLQGLTLVSFPASSVVLRQSIGLSDAQYGALFLPQVGLAILGALVGGSFSHRLGLKRILLFALLANAASQGLLWSSALFEPALGFAVVLAGTGCLGLGFGLAGAPLNGYPSLLYPARSSSALVALHSILGAGLAVGPLLVGFLMARELWAAFPLGLAAAAIALIFLVTASALPREGAAASPIASAVGPSAAHDPAFWLLAATAVLYAFAEGTFSNWAVLYVQDVRGLPMDSAAQSLSAFWAALVAGRLIVSALLLARVPSIVPWSILPVLIIGAFLFLPTVATPTQAVLGFALAGLACSAFFPLTVATAAERFPHAVAWVSSMLTAALMVGVGGGSFIVGALTSWLPLDELYRLSIVYPALVLGLILISLRRRPRPALP